MHQTAHHVKSGAAAGVVVVCAVIAAVPHGPVAVPLRLMCAHAARHTLLILGPHRDDTA